VKHSTALGDATWVVYNCSTLSLSVSHIVVCGHPAQPDTDVLLTNCRSDKLKWTMLTLFNPAGCRFNDPMSFWLAGHHIASVHLAKWNAFFTCS